MYAEKRRGISLGPIVEWCRVLSMQLKKQCGTQHYCWIVTWDQKILSISILTPALTEAAVMVSLLT